VPAVGAYCAGRPTGQRPAVDPAGVEPGLVVPVGGGDCLYGVWRGFADLREAGILEPLPRMVGCQTHAAGPLARLPSADLEGLARLVRL
jgi:threonine synthase